jgi:hypothetical protein
MAAFTNDADRTALALRIDAAVRAHASLVGVLIRVVLPNTPPAKSP